MNELELLLLKMHKEGRISVTGTYFVLMPDESKVEFMYAYSSLNDEVITAKIPLAGELETEPLFTEEYYTEKVNENKRKLGLKI